MFLATTCAEHGEPIFFSDSKNAPGLVSLSVAVFAFALLPCVVFHANRFGLGAVAGLFLGSVFWKLTDWANAKGAQVRMMQVRQLIDDVRNSGDEP